MLVRQGEHRGRRITLAVISLAAFGSLVAPGCATKGYVRDEVQRFDEADAEIRGDLDRVRATASDADQAAESASRDAAMAREFALGDVAFREADRYTVTFAFDSAELTADAHTTLDQAAAQVSEGRRYIVDIYGYTDTIGDPRYNDHLSTLRANEVLRYLTQQTEEPLGRFAFVGLGERDPIVRGSEEDHDAGRRVVVRLLERTEPGSPTQISRTTRTTKSTNQGEEQ